MIYVFDTCCINLKLDGDCFIVPEVLEELGGNLPEGFRVKSPDYINKQIPLTLLYYYIKDFGQRVAKGLKIAEAVLILDGCLDNKKRKLRKHWKQDMRSGILDTIADFQSVLLARELNAILVTVDAGMKKFANEMAVEVYQVDKNANIQEKT